MSKKKKTITMKLMGTRELIKHLPDKVNLMETGRGCGRHEDKKKDYKRSREKQKLHNQLKDDCRSYFILNYYKKIVDKYMVIAYNLIIKKH